MLRADGSEIIVYANCALRAPLISERPHIYIYTGIYIYIYFVTACRFLMFVAS